MFKLIRFLFSLLILCAIGFVVYVWFARVSILEYLLAKRFGEKVSVKELKIIGWNQLVLKECALSNPYQSVLPYACTIREIVIHIPLWKLFNTKIAIDKFEVFDPVLFIELYNSTGLDNNWVKILNGMPDDTLHPQGSFAPRYFTIGKLVLYNFKVEGMRNGKAFTLAPVRSIEFTNIGFEQPVTGYQMGKIILMALLHSLKPQLGDLLEHAQQVPKHLLQGVQSNIPNLEEFRGRIKEQMKNLKKKSEEGSEFFHSLLFR